MNDASSTVKKLYWVVVISLLGAVSACGEDNLQSKNTCALSLEQVHSYFTNRVTNTTLQNQRAETTLAGKTFQSVIEVSDVKENGNHVVVESPWVCGARCRFWISDPKLKETAANLKVGNRIQVNAKLKEFKRVGSGYINVGDSYYAEFEDVVSLELMRNAETK